jgi:hypothetical protein
MVIEPKIRGFLCMTAHLMGAGLVYIKVSRDIQHGSKNRSPT